MTFVQIVECKTDKMAELNKLMDNWVESTHGRRTATHAMVGADRSNAKHLVEIIEFPSYEEAMKNSSLPETDRIFREMVALCEEPPTFTDLDVVRDEQLNKATARRMFEAVSKGDIDTMLGLIASDYVGHDPASEGDIVGVEGVRQTVSLYLTGFDLKFTVESQLAEGDQVVTRWRSSGRHHGEFMGLPATDKVVETTGCTTMRFKDGKIQEEWWQWDNLGMLRQLGLARM